MPSVFGDEGRRYKGWKSHRQLAGESTVGVVSELMADCSDPGAMGVSRPAGSPRRILGIDGYRQRISFGEVDEETRRDDCSSRLLDDFDSLWTGRAADVVIRARDQH